MEVILKEDVNNLGHRGDVVKVADGYGRNFLLPKKLAIEATAPTGGDRADEAFGRPPLREGEGRGRSAGHADGAVSLASLGRWARTTTSSARSPPRISRSRSSRRASPSTAARCIWKSRSNHWASSSFPVSLHREVTAHLKVVIQAEEAA